MTEVLKPPRPLDFHGIALWNSIQAEYQIADPAGVELLAQACQALDRAEALASAIAEQGFVTDKGRANPLIRDELQARSFVTRTLQRLGLDSVAKSPGRPTGIQPIGHNRRRESVVNPRLRPWEAAEYD
jgi:hypothetical protein